MVAVLTFCYVPFVEVLAHYHESHLVAKFYQLLGRHVVGCADCIAAHILEHGELAAYGRLVYGCAKRTEVMVEAYSAELAYLSVEEESLVRTDLYRPESEPGADLVLEVFSVADAYLRSFHVPVGIDGSSRIYFCFSEIKYGALWRPKCGPRYRDVLLHLSLMNLSGIRFFRHDLAFCIDNPGLESHGCSIGQAVHLCPYSDDGLILSDIWCGHICSPYGYMDLGKRDVTYLPVKACSRVPSRRLRPVFQQHCQLIGPCLEVAGHIAPERVVSVWPETYLFSIDEDLSFAHGSVEIQDMSASVERLCRYF